MKNSLQARLNCSEPLAFKVKDKDVSITKKYCIPISIQKISSIHKFIFKIADFRAALAWLNFYQHPKNQLIRSVHFWNIGNFRVLWPDSPHSFLTMSTQQTFNHLFICMDVYQLILEIPRPDWPHPTKTFWWTLNFCQLIDINMLKMKLFHWFAWAK